MPSKSLNEWLEFISATHSSEIELGLSRIKSVFAKLPVNHSNAKIVLVAGTNGKGSTIAMIESGLLALGFRVGVYTSPHIHQYNERIRINAADVSDSELINSFESIEVARESTPLTYFEYGTLAALDILMSHELDVILLEIGLGGRLDAVNIIEPDLSIITSIGLDHTDWLGDTVEKIGLEKAGILRRNGLFIGGECLPDSVIGKAKALSCRQLICRNDFNVYQDEAFGKSLRLALTHQKLKLYGFPVSNLPENNILIALQATITLYDWLSSENEFSQPLYNTLVAAIEQIEVPGRLEQVLKTDKHEVFLDVGHNAHAAVYLHSFLRQYADQGAYVQLVYSSLLDKDVLGVLSELSSVASKCVLTQLECDRAMPLDKLTAIAHTSGFQVIESFADINQAIEQALLVPYQLQSAEIKVVTLILGSFFVVDAAKQYFRKVYD